MNIYCIVLNIFLKNNSYIYAFTFNNFLYLYHYIFILKKANKNNESRTNMFKKYLISKINPQKKIIFIINY